jgi:N-acyl amino acid synthase of PEP-CTERM/exosortase system
MKELPEPELYDRYFTVLPADTAELLDAAYRLRYEVYCVEHHFLDGTAHPDGREIDSRDGHSVHAVLVYRRTGEVMGCVRLVLPQSNEGMSALPVRSLLTGEPASILDSCDPLHTAEISRYAVSKRLRRRPGEELYPDVMSFSDSDARRLMPHVSVGLIRAVARLAADRGITKVCAVIAPALARLLERFGLVFEPLGPAIDYHGLRQPCLANIETLLAGLAETHPAHFHVVEAAYRGELCLPATGAALPVVHAPTEASLTEQARHRPA